MNIHIIRSDSEFVSLRGPWNSLATEPFASWEWNYWWWKHLGQENELRILVAESNGNVFGIAPLMIETRNGGRRLRFIGSGNTCTDYADFISTPAARDDFYAAVANVIETGDDFRVAVVELEGVTGNDNQIDFCRKLGSHFWRYDQEIESSWVIQLPATWDEFVRDLHRSQRRKIRKAEKQLASGEAKTVSTRDGLDFETAFDQLVVLHQSRFVSKGEAGVFAQPNFKMFLQNSVRELCEQDQAEIIVAWVDDRPIVAHLYLIGSAGPQLYQSGMCAKSTRYVPGHLLFTHTVKRAIENGLQSFDFLRGNEHYKSLWGAEPIPLYTIRCVSKNVTSTLTHQMQRGLRHLKHSFHNMPLFGSRGVKNG